MKEIILEKNTNFTSIVKNIENNKDLGDFIMNFFTRENITLFGCYLLCTGMFLSRAMMSIGMGIIFLATFTDGKLRSNFYDFISKKEFWIITLLFFLYLFSGLYTDNTAGWLERVRIRLPFLLLPFAFSSLKAFPERKFFNLIYFFALGIVFASIWAFANYILHYAEINQTYQESKVMPTPIAHIQMSLMMVSSIAIFIYLVYRKHIFRFGFEKYLQYFGLAFLVFFLHVLSCRSGLLAFYVLVTGYGIYYLSRTRNFKIVTAVASIIILVPILAYHQSTSFRNRIHNTHADISVAIEGHNPNHWPIAMRFLAWRIAFQLVKENPIFGVGIGDLQDDMVAIYKREHPGIEESNYKLPHNQFIHYLTSFGIVGLMIFLVVYFYPLLYREKYKFWLLQMHYSIFFVAMLVESSLQTQLGTSYFILFAMLGMLQGTQLRAKV